MTTSNLKTPRGVPIGHAIGVAIVLLLPIAFPLTASASEIDGGASEASTGVLSAAGTAAIYASPAGSSAAFALGTEEDAATPGIEQWPGSATNLSEHQSDLLDTASLTLWLPAVAKLPLVEGTLVERFLIAAAAFRAAQAAQSVHDQYWGLDGPSEPVDGEQAPLMSLSERDSFVAAEVAFVLGNVPAPEPDIVFLAFVFLQSLWGLVGRPRQS
ncbi:MAG TPA: hypothetical protein VGG30_01945 [Pirellulales bacterium]|jgi:hypothetical protein